MTTQHLVSRGFVDAAPVRKRIREFLDAKYSLYQLHKLTGVNTTTLGRIVNGNTSFADPDIAAIITSTTVADADAVYKPAIDPALLERIVDGEPCTPPLAKDKPAYARTLHGTYGWGSGRIADALSMSGTAVNKAISEAVA
ncbi:helix-turn-helix transcriptional regulator [Nocardia otitidiscaviarum]|uniref:helix-turn-helix transcriptional regulator n=1 Tax=Nocardia otitidiscaviarum TaxID=1823 RepID=UPI0004A73629|nr:helix-turn-helix transcriptional regulator [Nocardia otitidiscaviarum]